MYGGRVGDHEASAATAEVSRTETTENPTVAWLRGILARGRPSPSLVAQLIQKDPAGRGAVLALLHQTLGNSFVQEVAAALMSKPRAVQSKADDGDPGSVEPVAAAKAGVDGATDPMPHEAQIQTSFGRHDVSGIRTRTGGRAAQASQNLGAAAYAVGNRVGFAQAPDLHTSAHEAAHVIQQRSGVQLKGGVDGGKGDLHEQHADAVADRVVRGESAEGLLDGPAAGSHGSGEPAVYDRAPAAVDANVMREGSSANQHGDNGVNRSADGGGSGAQFVQRKPAGSPTPTSASETTTQSAAESIVDAAPSETFKVKHEFKTSSALSGAATLTVETGNSSLSVGGGKIKAFKEAATVKLQGMATKLETTLLTGNLETLDVIDGVKIALDLSALKATTDEKSLELLAITLKLQGDVTHWFGLPQVKVTIDGSVTYSLGSALAKELEAFVRADLEKRMMVKEFESVTAEVEQHAAAVRELESKLGKLEASGASRTEIAALEKELFAHKIQVSTGAQQLERLGNEFEKVEGLAAKTLAKIKGKPAKMIAGLMERQSMKLLSKTITKLIPALTVINAIATVRDAWKVIKAIKHGALVIGDAPGGGDGDQIGPPREHGGNSTSPAAGDGPESSKPDSHAHSGPQSADTAQDKKSTKSALEKLSQPARQIVDSLISHSDTGLSPTEITMIAMTIPPDLKPAEVAQIIAMLHAQGGRVSTGGQAIGAIGEAIRAVRGEPQSSQVRSVGDGPVTSPQQVADSSTSVFDVITTAPESVIASWFELKSGELVLSSAGHAWKAANIGKARVENHLLKDLQTGVAETGDGEWNLEVMFVMDGGKTIKHAFFVSQPRAANGAPGETLRFESYVMLR